jgi:phosphoribosylanthranilate isomerase
VSLVTDGTAAPPIWIGVGLPPIMNSGLFVKICGVTDADDARLVAESGASALGVNLFEGSKRHVDLEVARGWLAPLRGRLLRAAVVVDAVPETLDAIREAGCFDAVQFHGNESPEECAKAGFPRWIKAVRVRDEQSLREALAFDTPDLLLDAWESGEFGGTGRRLDWDLARDFILENRDRRVLLAGGLNPSNVRDAVRITRPWGVDAASGTELETPRKDPLLVREFVRHARWKDFPQP